MVIFHSYVNVYQRVTHPEAAAGEAAAPAPRLCRCQRHAPGSRSARRWSFGQNRGASPRRAGHGGTAARELKMGEGMADGIS